MGCQSSKLKVVIQRPFRFLQFMLAYMQYTTIHVEIEYHHKSLLMIFMIPKIERSTSTLNTSCVSRCVCVCDVSFLYRDMSMYTLVKVVYKLYILHSMDILCTHRHRMMISMIEASQWTISLKLLDDGLPTFQCEQQLVVDVLGCHFQLCQVTGGDQNFRLTVLRCKGEEILVM